MTISNALPPIPQPPHDPTSLLLNQQLGWQAITQGSAQVVVNPSSGALELALRAPRTLSEANGSFGGLVLPANIALGPLGDIYLLDAATLTLKRFDPCTCTFVNLPCFGGLGSGVRQLSNPHGIGICRGNLFVCDTANHRLGVFTLRGLLLRGHWQPPVTAGLTNAWEPYALAFDRTGRIYVTDRANGCIHRFRPSGQWEDCWSGFGVITQIAVDCQDQLYVLIEGTPSRVIMLNPEEGDTATQRQIQASPAELATRFPTLPFVVDKYGNLHLGALCVPPCAPNDDLCGIFDLHGNPITQKFPSATKPYADLGVFYTQALDSAIYQCQWHRILLRGQVPAGAQFTISTFTADVLYADADVASLAAEQWKTNMTIFATPDSDWDGLVRSPVGRYLWLRLELRSNGQATATLSSIEIEFPRISLRRYLPAVFGGEPVSTDFTDRFLSLFDTTMRSVEHTIDTQARYFDPLSAPAERSKHGEIDFLTWLGGWIGLTLDRHWPEAKRRQLLKRAGKLYDLRGTRTGLWLQLLLLLEMEPEERCCLYNAAQTTYRPQPSNCAPPIESPCTWQPPPLILEHFQLRRWLYVGAGRLGAQAVLWGKRIVNRSQLDEGAQVGHTQLKSTQDPLRDPFHSYAHKFSVFVPAHWGRVDHRRKALENLLKAESPAHTQAQIVYVEPRLRIGIQSMIGLDAVIGCLPQGVTLDQSALGSATVLTPTAEASAVPTLALGKNSRIGTTTRLD